MTITDLARYMLAMRADSATLLDSGHPTGAQAAFDESNIAWGHIVTRLRTVLAAR